MPHRRRRQRHDFRPRRCRQRLTLSHLRRRRRRPCGRQNLLFRLYLEML